jgi:hypothetical protein
LQGDGDIGAERADNRGHRRQPDQVTPGGKVCFFVSVRHVSPVGIFVRAPRGTMKLPYKFVSPADWAVIRSTANDEAERFRSIASRCRIGLPRSCDFFRPRHHLSHRVRPRSTNVLEPPGTRPMRQLCGLVWACALLGLLSVRGQEADEQASVDRHGAPLPKGAIARMEGARLRPQDNATTFAVALSPDGKLLVSDSYRGTLRLWNPATGEELPQPKPPLHGDRHLAFSPDGKDACRTDPIQPGRDCPL